jgi:MFS transporter, PAT family, beta-lactamase induction signal transducer AmpG
VRLSAKLGLLSSLYLAQGLPYGFFTQALPVVMRKEGLSLALIGAAAVLALPWGLKFLWAPLVDRYAGSALGARRGWILPLQGATFAFALLLAASRDLATGASLLALMAVAVVIMNLLAATQDIATDGLAVDLLRHRERGLGNGVQVAAYRVGMIIGGGVLVMVFDVAGWRATFGAMAAILALASAPILLFREPKSARHDTTERVALGAVMAFVRRPRVAAWLAVIAVYKLGDALLGPMARTMLVDAGYTLADIGWLFGTWGSAAGLAGAMLGGLAAQRAGRLPALVGAGLVHTALLAAWAWPALLPGVADARTLIAVLVVVEHLTGGMATVALFTAMMDICDARTGGTDYTVQASVVVATQFLGSVLSGISAQTIGYGGHFLVTAAVSLLGVVVMARAFARRPDVPGDEPAERDEHHEHDGQDRDGGSGATA